MIESIKYKDQDLPLFKPQESVVFPEDGELMAVSNGEDAFALANVIAYLPSRDYPVVTKATQYKYCAKLPLGSVVQNEYLDSLSIQRGQVQVITDTSFKDILESLCKITLDAAKAEKTVFFISSKTKAEDLYERLKNMADFPMDKNPIYLKHGWKDMRPNEIRQAVIAIEKSKKHPKVDLLVIDSLEATISPYRSRKDSLLGLKELAREKNMPVITSEIIQ